MEFDKIKEIIKQNNPVAIEIAGPTLLFTKEYNFYIYDIFSNIDNINLYDLNDSYQFTKNSENNKIYNNTYNYISEIKKKYDIIINSHLIEHMANPIKILNEYKTILKNESYILSFVPNKMVFWDSIRETTTFNHILDDFKNDVGEDDPTHIEENLSVNHPFKLMLEHPDRPNGTFEDLCKNNINHRIMHHHCFDQNLVMELHEYIGFQTISCFVSPIDNLQIIYFGKLK
jgi:SAM-dependent methyltransferase